MGNKKPKSAKKLLKALLARVTGNSPVAKSITSVLVSSMSEKDAYNYLKGIMLKAKILKSQDEREQAHCGCTGEERCFEESQDGVMHVSELLGYIIGKAEQGIVEGGIRTAVLPLAKGTLDSNGKSYVISVGMELVNKAEENSSSRDVVVLNGESVDISKFKDILDEFGVTTSTDNREDRITKFRERLQAMEEDVAKAEEQYKSESIKPHKSKFRQKLEKALAEARAKDNVDAIPPKPEEALKPALVPYPDYGTAYTAGQWEQHLKDGSINGDDGIGYWATESGVSGVDAFGDRPVWATHVAWFNK